MVLRALLFLLAMSLPRLALAADTVATGARVGGDDTRTRFVADLNQTVSYTVYVLPDPYRVMIDMPGVTFDFPPDSGQKTRGLISEYRYGQVGTGRSRIVIDTKGPVLIEKSFLVEPQAGQPARIVVDLVQTSEQAFRQTLHKEEQVNAAAVAAADTDSTANPGSATKIAAAPPAGDTGVADAPLVLPQAEVVTPAAAPKHKTRRLVVIDPGHGGIDPGAIGLNHTKEKDVVLAFGLALRDILLKTGQYDVVMTRSGDTFVTLDDRVRIARDNAADLFIAIHADTVRGQEARGATIYTLSEKASDAEAGALAQKENRADIIGGIDLGAQSQQVKDILINLAQRESKTHSIFFAKKAVGEMKAVTGFTGKPMRSAGFVVLKAPDVPSVLVELGYLSSKHDEAQLSADSWRGKVAAAMAHAIDTYFATEVASRGN